MSKRKHQIRSRAGVVHLTNFVCVRYVARIGAMENTNTHDFRVERLILTKTTESFNLRITHGVLLRQKSQSEGNEELATTIWT